MQASLPEGSPTVLKRAWKVWKARQRWQKLALLVAIVLVASFAAGVVWIFAGLPDVHALEAGMALPSTRIFDRQGRLLYQIADPQTGFNRVVPLDEFAPCLIDATIATEDANFYRHPGIDVEGVARALWINLRGGEVVAGGSTITQQVARNLLLDPAQRAERTLRRKLRESVLALELTRTYSRDEILALYLNQTYYGNLAYGAEAAARAYFGKSASELTLAECAMIAGLPQAPGLYDPLSNLDGAQERQRVVLDLMVRHGAITQAEADRAANETLQYAASPFPIEAPHFVAAVWTQLERDYAEALHGGGLEVTTTLDLSWQQAAQEAAQRHLDRLNHPPVGEPSHNARNAALVALDPYTGQILAMLGSPDYFDERSAGAVNAALAPRQPGSALKPFTYAAAFDPAQAQPWTPATMILDVATPFITRRLESYTPANFGLVEHGPVLVREALASSYNIPAVVTLDHIGLDALLRLVTRLGISTLTDSSRLDLAVTLGGGEVRLLELTAAYAALANGGYRVDPVYILEVRDRDGHVLYQWHQPQRTRPELDPRIAFLVTDILSDPQARIPAFGAASPLNIGRPAAAKTGTTTDFRDNWTVGYTPNLTVGVWVGNADNAPMVEVSGISGAGPIWSEFMRRVLLGQPELEFAQPEGLVRAEVCATSGLLPSEYCPRTRWEWFIDGTVPTREDNLYQPYTLDRRTGLLADDATPPEDREQRVYLILPPEARDWALRQGIPQPPIGAQLVGVDAHEPRLLSPDPYTVFRLTPLLPEDQQQIRFAVAAPQNTLGVTYVLDGVALAEVTQAPFDYWWALLPGDHSLHAELLLDDGTEQVTADVPFSVGAYEDRPTSGTLD